MSVNGQLQDIQRTLGEHTGMLKGIEKKGGETRESIRDLWKSQSVQDEKITVLRTKATFIGAAAGAFVAAVIGAIRWFAGK